MPGSGRRKGVPNKLGREAREYLASHSDYLKTICALAKGKPIKFAARRGHKPTWHQPDWPDVKWALETIVNKLVPTVAQSEITGADGAAFMPEPISRERTMLETARAVGFLMSLGEQDAGEPSPVSSLRKPETPAPVGKVSDLPFTKDAIRAVKGMPAAQALDYLRAKGDALKLADDEDGRAQGMSQFLDEKSYRPGLGPYQRRRAKKD